MSGTTGRREDFRSESVPLEDLYEFFEILRCDHFETGNERRLRSVQGRHNERLHPEASRGDGRWQNARHMAQRTIEGEFAEERSVLESVFGNRCKTVGYKEAESDGKVVPWSDLLDIRGRKVHGDHTPRRELVPAAAESHADALLTFLDRRIAETNNEKIGAIRITAAGRTDLDRDPLGPKTKDRKST